MKYEKLKTPEELLTFMDQNIVFGFIGKNGKKYTNMFTKAWEEDWYSECIVQSGEEVLKTRIGTCWDQVELERLWFKTNDYEFKTIFIWFEMNEENDLPTHTFLVYKSDNKYCWFEHSFEDNKGIHEFDTFEKVIECVKQKQLEAAINSGKAKIEQYNLIKAYEFEEPLSNISVSEYLKHVTKRLLEFNKL